MKKPVEMVPSPPDVAALWRAIDREVWIVTAAHAGRRGGLVATWVNRASLDPRRPLVLVALASSHFTTELALASGEFAAHLLSPENMQLALQFALGSGRDRDKFLGIVTEAGALAAPILPATLAAIECRTVKHYDARERHYLWAEIVSCPFQRAGNALRESQLIGAATPEQRQQLQQDLAADVARLAPKMAAWLAS